jgi:hypothetical protein
MVLAVAMEFERVTGPVGLRVAQTAELAAGFDEVAEVSLGIGSREDRQLWSVCIRVEVSNRDKIRGGKGAENTGEIEEPERKGGSHDG